MRYASICPSCGNETVTITMVHTTLCSGGPVCQKCDALLTYDNAVALASEILSARMSALGVENY